MIDTEIAPSNPIYLGHSSPVVCLVDALDIISDLYFHLVLGYGLQEAAWRINWRRATDRLGPEIEIIEETPFGKYPIATGLIFLGSLTQVIKIFACGGILWAKILVGMYLSSYIVLTIMTSLPPRHWRTNRPPWTLSLPTDRFRPFYDYTLFDHSDTVWIIGVLVQGVLYVWEAGQIVSRSDMLWGNNLEALPCRLGRVLLRFPTLLSDAFYLFIPLVYGHVVVLILSWGFFSVFEAFETSRGRNRCTCLGATILSVGLAAIPFSVTLSCLRLLIFGTLDYETVMKISNMYLIPLLVLWALWMPAVKGWVCVCKRMDFQLLKPEVKRMPALLRFATFNLLTLILQCCIGYNPGGTIKPEWTEKLG